MHLDTVIAERAKYGTPLGYANAWSVINAVALKHAAEGWGLVSKPTGTNHNGYSVDVLLNNKTGQAVDCLGDAEGEGRPGWNVLDAASTPTLDRWRQPVGVVVPDPVTPVPDPITPTPEPSDLAARVASLEADVARIKAWTRGV